MEVVGDQRPGEAVRGGGVEYEGQTLQEAVAIHIVQKNGAHLDPPHHDMVQRPRPINARFPWHSRHFGSSCLNNWKTEGPPLFLLFSYTPVKFEGDYSY